MKRFTDMLAGLARRYPDLWKNIDRIRAGRGQDGIADWPETRSSCPPWRPGGFRKPCSALTPRSSSASPGRPGRM